MSSSESCQAQSWSNIHGSMSSQPPKLAPTMKPRSTAQRCVADVLESALPWVSESILWVVPDVRPVSGHGHGVVAQRRTARGSQAQRRTASSSELRANTAGPPNLFEGLWNHWYLTRESPVCFLTSWH